MKIVACRVLIALMAFVLGFEFHQQVVALAERVIDYDAVVHEVERHRE